MTIAAHRQASVLESPCCVASALTIEYQHPQSQSELASTLIALFFWLTFLTSSPSTGPRSSHRMAITLSLHRGPRVNNCWTFWLCTLFQCLCLFASLYTPYIKYDSEQFILSSFPHLSYFCFLDVHILGMMHVVLLIDDLLQRTPRNFYWKIRSVVCRKKILWVFGTRLAEKPCVRMPV